MENYGIGLKYSELSDQEQEARLKLIEKVIEEKRQLTEEEAIEICGKQGLYEELKRKKIFALSDNLVTFLYPISALPTNHRVKLEDGREFYSMCAVDALGVSAMFHMDSEIRSCCSATGEEIYIKISEDKIIQHSPEEIYVLHVDLTKESNWAADC